MSDLITRSEQAISALTDSSQGKWARYEGAMRAFSGLELSALTPDIRSDFEAAMKKINGILDHYSLEGPEDYDSVSENDLDLIIDTLHLAAKEAIDAEVDRIVRELREAKGALPVSAINEARRHRDLIIPLLKGAIEDTITMAKEEILELSDLRFFSLFLLTEFEVRDAVPLILEALTLHEDWPYQLFGDAATMMLPRILARFWDGDFESVDALVRNTELMEEMRRAAAETYIFLVRDGRITRDDAVERLRRHMRWAIDQNDGELASGLVLVMNTLAPAEAMDDIREAYCLELIHPFFINLEDVEKSVAGGREFVERQLERYPPTGMPDTIEELEGWAAFTEPPKPPAPEPRILPQVFAHADDALSAPLQGETTFEESRRNRIGRNDPCPCGSGKKYKKCCLRR